MEENTKFNRYHHLIIIIGLSLLTLPGVSAASTYDATNSSIINQRFAVNDSFVYNPKTLQWQAVTSDGQVVRTGHGSGGQSYCPDIHRSCHTPTGTFHVIGKRGPECRSSRYPVGRGGAPMPYCMYFSKYYAVHGSYEVPNRNASHGCIRVKPDDARWLYHNFMKVGTKVVVKPY